MQRHNHEPGEVATLIYKAMRDEHAADERLGGGKKDGPPDPVTGRVAARHESADGDQLRDYKQAE
jgi:hypothetical protein